ncbi:MAG TPA: EscU/YscU/HrcU family type III secretion system export apparatus switch protein [Alphaproteobacteria bacterium]|nr:EscU/YscU/HrcU family type III secretion system export apparatus switch protein [Alphaproteobacteria bacterium]
MAKFTDIGDNKPVKTPLAVAVRRDPDCPSRTRVIAQASGPLAEELCALAARHKIALHQDADLAALLTAVEIDHDIPVAAFGVVAGILTELFRANQAFSVKVP